MPAFPADPESLASAIAAEWKRRGCDRTLSPSELTVGIEHEFFLLDGGAPVTHAASQGFLAALAESRGFAVRKQGDDALGAMIWEVARDEDDGRFTSVKYDHAPHLFEIAFGYKRDLNALSESVQQLFELVDATASRLGLRAAHQPLLDITPDAPAVSSPLRQFVDLRHYRSVLLHKRGLSSSPHRNYAAVIAATQTQVGIVPLAAPGFIDGLYRLEPRIAGVGYVAYESSAAAVVRDRWAGYRTVFEGFPLIGFPRLSSWSLSAYADALFRTPLAGGPTAVWAAETVAALPTSPFETLDDFVASVRDLQLIRPRLYGTVEFRGDPAQPSPTDVLRVAAARLAQCLLPAPRDVSFTEAGGQYWRAVENGKWPDVITEQLQGALRARGHGEERFLEQT